MMTQSTAALAAALFRHLKGRCANKMLCDFSIYGHNAGTCRPCVIDEVATNAKLLRGWALT